MRAIVRDRYGSPAVLELREIERPVAGDDEVLVQVQAAGVNMADVDYLRGQPYLARLGTGLPRPRNPVLGLDVAGTVEAVGVNVTRFQPLVRAMQNSTRAPSTDPGSVHRRHDGPTEPSSRSIRVQKERAEYVSSIWLLEPVDLPAEILHENLRFSALKRYDPGKGNECYGRGARY